MDFQESISWLEARGVRRIEPGLSRVEALLACLGHPQRGLRGIHVVGTNGKGSTAAMAVAALAQVGLVVGSMPSPHLQDYTERIRINSAPIAPADFAALLTLLRPAVERLDRVNVRLTHFEILTCAALTHFAAVGVDVAVVEAGLGGRDDATAVLDLGVKVLTSVGLDHEEFLGDTLASVATHKIGIVGDGDDVVLGPLEPAAQSVVDAACARAAPERVWQLDRQITMQPAGAAVQISTPTVSHAALIPPLPGAHQRGNLALAVAAVDAASLRHHLPQPTGVHWRQALDSLQWPGRLERVTDAVMGAWRGTIVLDGAHNPHAMRAVAAELAQFGPAPPVVVLAVMRDKSLRRLLECLPRNWPLVLTGMDSPRAADPDQLRAALPPERREVHGVASVAEALRRAADLAGEQRPIAVLGSLLLVGAVRDLLGLKPL